MGTHPPIVLWDWNKQTNKNVKKKLNRTRTPAYIRIWDKNNIFEPPYARVCVCVHTHIHTYVPVPLRTLVYCIFVLGFGPQWSFSRKFHSHLAGCGTWPDLIKGYEFLGMFSSFEVKSQMQWWLKMMLGMQVWFIRPISQIFYVGW